MKLFLPHQLPTRDYTLGAQVKIILHQNVARELLCRRRPKIPIMVLLLKLTTMELISNDEKDAKKNTKNLSEFKNTGNLTKTLLSFLAS